VLSDGDAGSGTPRVEEVIVPVVDNFTSEARYTPLGNNSRSLLAINRSGSQDSWMLDAVDWWDYLLHKASQLIIDYFLQ